MKDLNATSEFNVSEDGRTFIQLLDAMYGKGMRQPPISMHSVGTILELARKYDVANVLVFCDMFLSQQTLTCLSLNLIHQLADSYNLNQALTHCRTFAAANFRELSRLYPGFSEWLPRISAEEQAKILQDRVRILQAITCNICLIHTK